MTTKNPRKIYEVFQLKDSSFVYGAEMELQQVIYAHIDNRGIPQVHLRPFEKKIEVLPFDKEFSKNKTLSQKLQGILYFPEIGEKILSEKKGTLQNSASFEIYTVLRRTPTTLEKEVVKFYNGDLEQLYGNSAQFNISQNLFFKNPFFESDIFLRGEKAEKKIKEIQERKKQQIIL